MNDDIDDFVTLTEHSQEAPQKNTLGRFLDAVSAESEDEREPVEVGGVTQYSRYGAGFTATTPTIATLPPGCYDIIADQRGIHAMPALPPTGLLLELPEMRSKEILDIADRFWESEKDYKEGNEFVHGGASFKSGIMIYGPAGTGKSCTIKLVSRDLVKNKGVVFYADNNPQIIMTFLGDFTRVEKNRKCVVIMEDIDSLIARYGENGYLEMLDSAKSIDNVLFIATTNYPDRLDPRIYNRPGRFSHVVKVGLPLAAARAAFLKAILKNHKDVDYIVSKTDGFSIDHLSAIVNSVYREKKDLNVEIDRLRRLFKVPKADESVPIGLNQT